MPSATTHPDPGVTREQLRLLVERFYGAIREDAQLGPIFDQRVRDWDIHLDKMTRFWCSALLREGSYHGNPIEAHRFGGLSVELFDRWLGLFERVSNEVLGELGASRIVPLARRMGRTIAMRAGIQSALD
ncbi:MAG: group III truncated hemoglobin [Phycisphaerales bacterium]